MIPEPTTFNGEDTRAMPSVESREDEEAKEYDWHYLESEAIEFAKRYGPDALLRCIAGVFSKQRGLFK